MRPKINCNHHAAERCNCLETIKTQEGWKKEFDLFWGIAPEGSLKWHKGEDVKDFIRSLFTNETVLKGERRRIIHQIREEATKAECERWMNQPANEHDARIRADEREKVAREIGEEILKGILVKKPRSASESACEGCGFSNDKQICKCGWNGGISYAATVTQKYYSHKEQGNERRN